ncbi:MAG: succinate dehydrogenase cytochrome b subunit [Candidatus Dadabacteria bacterium]
MKWSQFFTSAVGRKIVMALTGFFLIVFLLVHVGLNSTIFYDLKWLNPNDNGEMFNKAANFMGSTIVMRLLEIVLFIGFIIHIIQGYVVELKNRTRRGTGYKISMGNTGSTWYSRSMAILGTLIFLYLIMHVAQFWVPSRITKSLEEVSYAGIAHPIHNLYLRMFEVFQQPFVVVLYLIGVLSLAYHLMHGFQSAFRSIGVHNRKYLGMLKGLGYAFTIIVCVLFALMPISMYLSWVSPY